MQISGNWSKGDNERKNYAKFGIIWQQLVQIKRFLRPSMNSRLFPV